MDGVFGEVVFDGFEEFEGDEHHHEKAEDGEHFLILQHIDGAGDDVFPEDEKKLDKRLNHDHHHEQDEADDNDEFEAADEGLQALERNTHGRGTRVGDQGVVMTRLGEPEVLPGVGVGVGVGSGPGVGVGSGWAETVAWAEKLEV